MHNIGSVIYTLTSQGLAAQWVFSKAGKITQGTGVGVRQTQLNPEQSFVGTYEITYATSKGKKYPTLELTISFEQRYYHLVWRSMGEILYKGIGLEAEGKLSAGWYELSEG